MLDHKAQVVEWLLLCPELAAALWATLKMGQSSTLYVLPPESKKTNQTLCFSFCARWYEVQQLVFHLVGDMLSCPKLWNSQKFD